jgi:phosphoribosylaminoimidazole carboxylase (NCAIR synthetase)
MPASRVQVGLRDSAETVLSASIAPLKLMGVLTVEAYVADN